MPADARRQEIEALLRAVFAVADETEAGIARKLVQLGLTAQQSQALFAIDPNEPAPAMKVLAERLRVDRSSVTFLADKLVERGFTERVPDSRDRRSKALRLTADGVRARAAMVEEMATVSPLGRLGSEDRHALLRLLRLALGS